MNRQNTHIPWWYYPNVLGLDAPLVAVAWMYVFAKIWSLQYVESLLAPLLGLTVWMIYTLDHLINAKLHGATSPDLRLAFFKRHAKILTTAVVLAAIVTPTVALLFLQWSVVTSAMLPVIGVAGFFIISVFSQPQQRVSYTKNVVAGFTFALGCVAGLIGLSARNMGATVISPELVSFALLCVCSIIAVDFWAGTSSTDGGSDQEEVKEWSLTFPLVALALFALLYKSKGGHSGTRPFFDVIVVCAGLMYLLNRMHQRMSPELLRVAAHLVLLSGAGIYWMIYT